MFHVSKSLEGLMLHKEGWSPVFISIFILKLSYVLHMKVVQASVVLVLDTPTSPIVDIVLKMQDERYLLWLSSVFYLWLFRSSSQ